MRVIYSSLNADVQVTKEGLNFTQNDPKVKFDPTLKISFFELFLKSHWSLLAKIFWNWLDLWFFIKYLIKGVGGSEIA